MKRIVEAIVRDENSILTVSSMLDGQYGLSDICLSLPTIVNNRGIGTILDIPLDNNELELLNKSAQSLKEVIKELEF